MKRLLHILSVLSVLLFSSLEANGQEVYDCVFNKAKGDWNVAENWTPAGVPSPYDKKVLVPAGCEVLIPQGYTNNLVHYVTVEGKLVIGSGSASWESRVMGPLKVSVGAVVESYGSLELKNGNDGSSHAGKFDVYGSVTLHGAMNCGPTTVYESGNLLCEKNIQVNSLPNGTAVAGEFVVYGSVHSIGNVDCGSLSVEEGADVVCDAGLRMGGSSGGYVGELMLSGSLSVAGRVDMGSIDIQLNDGTSISVNPSLIYCDGWTGEYNSMRNAILAELRKYGLMPTYLIWNGQGASEYWDDANNWDIKQVPTQNDVVTIKSCWKKPKLKSGVNAVAGSIAIDNDMSLTLEAGSSLDVKKVYVGNNFDGSQITINNRYDNVSSLRIKEGVIIKTYSNNGVQVEEVYNKLTINTEYLTGITYYIGSATTEGTFTGWLGNLNDESVKAGKRDELYLYNPVMQEFSFGQTISGVKGASVYLYWKQDGVTKNTRTLTQKGTIRKQNDGIIESLSLRAGEQFGWNIISNPYLFAFNLEDESQFNKSDDIDFVMFRRFRNGSYESVTHSFGTGVTLPNDATEMSGDLYIAPQQGFYVKAKKAGSYFGFVPSNVPSTGEGSIGSSRLKSAKVVNDVLYLSINGNVSSKGEDQTALVFREGGSLAVNGVDADKKMESAANNHLYQLKGEGEYAIGLYPTVDEVYDEIFPLGYIVAKGATEAMVRAVNLDEFDNSVDVYLCDMYSGVQYDLRKNDTFTFDVDTESETGVRVDDRFAIALKANKNAEVDVPTSVECNVASVVSINSADGDICVGVVGYEGQADAYVYDVAGRLVVRNAVSQGSNRISVPANGMYVVEVVAGDYLKNAKVLVK